MSPAPLAHPQPDLVGTQKSSGQVHIHDPPPVLDCECLNRSAVEQGCVVDQDVNPAEVRGGRLDHGFNLVFIGDVGL